MTITESEIRANYARVDDCCLVRIETGESRRILAGTTGDGHTVAFLEVGDDIFESLWN